MNTENSKTSEPDRFKLDLTDKHNLKNPNKNMALANLSIYYTWKNIKLLTTRGAAMFFIIEKSEEITFNFSQNSVTIIKIMETEKIVNLLNGSENENSKFAATKRYVIESESKDKYSHPDPIKFLTKSIELSLCDYSDYIF